MGGQAHEDLIEAEAPRTISCGKKETSNFST